MLTATYNAQGWAYDLHAIPYDGTYEGGNAQPRERTAPAMTLRARIASAMTNRPRTTSQMTRRDR